MLLSMMLAATVNVGSMDFPTYPYSDPDPVPATDKSYWPYSRHDGSSATAVTQAWRMVTLESDRLKVMMLPDVGGKVWGAVDKLTGREFIYFNHAVKFRDIAMCGPWCSGGIEFNFGIFGHAPTTAAPVSWTTRENADGSVSYFCGDTERICGTTWQVEVRLRDGEDHFTTRTQWFNGSELDEPYYQWMTAAYTARGNPELHYPGTHAVSHGGDASPWPYDALGRNLSVYLGNAFGDAKSYHVIGGDERFFGIWWPAANFGSYHENDSGEKYGRKIFMWALSRAGGIWEDLLTDTDGQYIELQSGRVFNQPSDKTWKTPFRHPTFSPGRTDVFTERWGVMRDRSRLEEHEKLANQTERPVRSPSDFDWDSAYGLYVQAEQELRSTRNVRAAYETIGKALAKDANLPPAVELAAEIAYRRGEWKAARRHASRALAINAYSPKANYIDALSCVKTGDDATALERFGLAAYSMEYRSAAEAAMAAIKLRRGDPVEAERLVAKSLEANALNLNAQRLRVKLARTRGETAKAEGLVKAFAEVWPTVVPEPSANPVKDVPDWQVKYRKAQQFAAVGRDAEAKKLLEECGEVEDAAFRLYRARQREGAAKKADILAARRIADSWRVGVALARFDLATNGYAAAEATLADYNRRFPGKNPIEILYAETLQKLGRNRECVEFLKGVRVLPSEFGGVATKIWQAAWEELGDGRMAESYPENLGQGKPFPRDLDGRRPYELVRANRRADEVKPVLPLVSGDGWTVACSNAEAKVTNAVDHLLFGEGVMRLDYRATGTNPVVKVLLEKPVKLAAFDAFSYWLYGNNFYGSRHDGVQNRKVPMVDVVGLFEDADGRPFDLGCTWVHHQEWCKFQYRVPEDRIARTRRPGCRFLGWRIVNGTNETFERLDFTSVCCWLENSPPLSFKQRAKRGVQVFADQDQGVNTGGGRLPFPTVETTIVPLAEKSDGSIEFRFPEKDGEWDDLAFRVNGGEWIPLALGGGVWPRSAAAKAKTTFRRVGDSVVADVVVKGGEVSELRFGEIGLPTQTTKRYPIPFLPISPIAWDLRPNVLAATVCGEPVFVSAMFDWTQSGGSEPFGPSRVGDRGIASCGGVFYGKKTDGTRNDVYERFVWTVSRKFEATLPEIPNPVSPYKAVAGANAWTANGAKGNRDPNRREAERLLRNGVRQVIWTDHETMWRDGLESFTFRTNAAPARGGNRAQIDYTRWMIETNGFHYGPYNNFTDLMPLNEYWHGDHLLRRSDGRILESWSRCFAPKPLYGLEMCEKLTPVNQSIYGFNTAYCDVHTAQQPWRRTDYDARVPGAGTFAQTFYAHGEILLLQRKFWNGPVSSEGGSHAYYVGLVDENYAQDSIYDFWRHPWILDFALLQMHPKCADHGPYLNMLLHGDEKLSAWGKIDYYLAYQLAFGHTAFLLPEHKEYAYYMNLAIAAGYAVENAKSIRYVDASGDLLTTSQAALNGAIARNQVVVEYDGGTKVVVNGSPRGERMNVAFADGRLDLPAMGAYAESEHVAVFAGERNGRRAAFCRAPDYVYVSGRGNSFACPGGATDGEFVRIPAADGSEEAIPITTEEDWTYIELPYRAISVTGLGRDGVAMKKPVVFSTTPEGRTRILKAANSAYSFRLVRPGNFAEPSVAAYRATVLAKGDVPGTENVAAEGGSSTSAPTPTSTVTSTFALGSSFRPVMNDVAAVVGQAEVHVTFDGVSLGVAAATEKDGVLTRVSHDGDWKISSRFRAAAGGGSATLEIEVENACIRTDTMLLEWTPRGNIDVSVPGGRLLIYNLRYGEKRNITFKLER